MPQAPDCRWADVVIQRALVGVAVSDEKVERALDHIDSCSAAHPRFEVRPAAALHGMEEEPEMARGQPSDVFQRALIAVLASPETIARRRAAQRLGGFDHVGIPALEALAATASEDPELEVREAALVALDELDEQISIPQRLIELWSASPAQAAPFIAGVLSRLASGAPPTPGVTRLAVSPRAGEERLAVTGEGGVEGSVMREGDELWLELSRLPASFERTSPVVALPGALGPDPPAVEWPRREPGLIPAPGPVAQGSLRVRLGRVEESPPRFDEIYLLSPERRRRGR